MNAIWKYEVEVTDMQVVEMPDVSNIISAQVQDDKICLWVEVDTDDDVVKDVVIEVFGTGNKISDTSKERRFIDTVQFHGGELVFHVYAQV